MAPYRLDPQSLSPASTLAAILAWQSRRLGSQVSITHDGRDVPAREGEPLAIALLASGTSTLARSVKFHRPRGPSCLRAACEGCLMRVDGVPNVMACRSTARAGSRVESQNAFPTAALDLLRVTDWFFPRQFDHHHLLVDYGTAINRAMQPFARRMAGLGTLPDADGRTMDPEYIACDALIVGGGPAGLTAATEIARAGFRVTVVEEESVAGGTLLDDLEPVRTASSAATGFELARTLADTAIAAGANIRTSASAVCTYDNETIVVAQERALVVRPHVRLFANGGHEFIGSFDSNDLPGIYTARAAARALAHGVSVGKRVVVVGSAWPAAGVTAGLRVAGVAVTSVPAGEVRAAFGRKAIQSVSVSEGSGAARELRCDALVVAEHPTPSYELLGQAGVAIDPDAKRACFVPRCTADGSTERADVFAAGSVRGGFDPDTDVDVALADGRRVAARAIAQLASRARAQPAPGGRAP